MFGNGDGSPENTQPLKQISNGPILDLSPDIKSSKKGVTDPKFDNSKYTTKVYNPPPIKKDSEISTP